MGLVKRGWGGTHVLALAGVDGGTLRPNAGQPTEMVGTVPPLVAAVAE